MLKRPINPQFNAGVKVGQKTTTIRKEPWPVNVPIMLYNWTGKPYRSKQADVAEIRVLGWWPIRISRDEDDIMSYESGKESAAALWRTEGFTSQEEMDRWFRPLVKKGESLLQHLILFKLA